MATNSEKLSLRLPADIVAELRNAAMADTRSVAQVARMVLAKWAHEREVRRNSELRSTGPAVPEEGVASDPFA